MKLDDTVTDSNLRKIDEWVMNVQSTLNRRMAIYSTSQETIYARVIGNGVFYTDDTFTTELGKTATLTQAQGGRLYLGAGEYKVFLSNKYKLRNIESLLSSYDFAHTISIDCKYLGYSETWMTLNLNGVKLQNFPQFAIDKVDNFRLYSCGLDCDISVFVDKILPTTTLQRFVLQDDTLTGDATEMGSIHAFVNSPNNTVVSISGTGMTGTYDVFCNKLFNQGKTSGTLQVHMPGDPSGDGTYTNTFSESGWSRS
jgi:hypothetical protein